MYRSYLLLFNWIDVFSHTFILPRPFKFKVPRGKSWAYHIYINIKQYIRHYISSCFYRITTTLILLISSDLHHYPLVFVFIIEHFNDFIVQILLRFKGVRTVHNWRGKWYWYPALRTEHTHLVCIWRLRDKFEIEVNC